MDEKNYYSEDEKSPKKNEMGVIYFRVLE